ncbi:MAG: hybrid sensor histidine kinase/response regulator [Anaerolineaceae bacterium]|nr:hybrid sensor histidine kinase/response regulator [Anaerolineaceae bacterium]
MFWIRSVLGKEESSKELLLSTSRYVVSSTGGIYLFFHFIASLFYPQVFSPRLWVCTIIMLATFLITLFLMERLYLLAQLVWLSGITIAVMSAYHIFLKPEILYLLSVLPLMAVVTLGVRGTLILEVMLTIFAFSLPQIPGIPPVSSGNAVGLVFSFIFSGVFGWGISSNMLSAIESSSFHYFEARRRLEETRKHRAEISRMLKELSQYNYQLKQMNRMLEQARVRAEEAREDRDRFAMAVSHELRSPLNFILGFSDLMVNAPETYAAKEDWPTGLFDDTQEIYNSSKHLLGLINDILDMGKMDARRMPLFRERVRPAVILEEISELLSSQVNQKGLEMEINQEDDLPYIFVDRTRIRQVLLNIITNSLRFTQEGKIVIDAYLKSNEELEIDISDTGPGIAKEDLEKIFDEFRQVGQENWSREKSTGLGLPISKRFVELHGGKMSVESEMGQGTIIRFSLPLIEPLQTEEDEHTEDHETGEQVAAIVHARKQSDVVLCYSQDPIQAKLVGQSLVEQEVTVAESVSSLKELTLAYYPAALLLDEAVLQQEDIQRYLQQLPFDLPVISFLFAGIPNHSISYPFGIFRYLVKPVSRERLVDTIHSLGGEIRQLLVVDDDPTMVRLFTQAIKSTIQMDPLLEEINFIPAYSGNEALSILKSQPVDAILLDLDLPDIHGTQVMAEIKKNGQTRNIPIIIISASDLSEDMHLEESANLQILINRPFERDELSMMIQTALKNLRPQYQDRKN